MKSVGEAMAMGRTFQESFQKALRSLETGMDGFRAPKGPAGRPSLEDLKYSLRTPNPDRMLALWHALDSGMSGEEVGGLDRRDFVELKRRGFSDPQLAACIGEGGGGLTPADVRAARAALGVRPAMKRVDTCAAEF